jgi:hypothetical protein
VQTIRLGLVLHLHEHNRVKAKIFFNIFSCLNQLIHQSQVLKSSVSLSIMSNKQKMVMKFWHQLKKLVVVTECKLKNDRADG